MCKDDKSRQVNQRIWYVHPYAGGPGIGRYTRPFALAKNWVRLGHEALIITAAFHHLLDAQREAGRERVGGVDYEFLPANRYEGNGFGRLASFFLFPIVLLCHARRLLRSHGRPSIIICSSPHPYHFITCQLLAKLFSAQLIFEVRDLWPLSLVELAGAPKWHPLVLVTGVLEKYAYRHAAVVSLLPSTKEYMVERGLDHSKWWYIPNGVTPDEIPGKDTDGSLVERVREAKRENFSVVIYAGALGPPNNMHVFVDAIESLLIKTTVPFKVVIVGRGTEWESIRKKISDAGLCNVISMVPQVSKSEVMCALALSDVAYASLRAEPIFRFGVSQNKLYDYMLAGLPVVFAVDTPTDLVSQTRCGIVAPPGDSQEISAAIEGILKKSELERKEMGERGKQYVLENNTYAVLAQKYIEVFSRL